jgi:hypothetical protein
MSICKTTCEDICETENEKNWGACRTVHLAKCGDLQKFIGEVNDKEFEKNEDYARIATKSYCKNKVTSKGGRKHRKQKRRNTKKKRRNHKK